MKRMALLILALVGLLSFPQHLFADAQKHEWFADWDMNHDGHAGTLRIAELKADCADSPWCDMAINYVDSSGVRYTGSIERVDDKWQHMVFYINFPGNQQKFDAYLFSWNKLKMAGTTYWGGRTFGFYATTITRVFSVTGVWSYTMSSERGGGVHQGTLKLFQSGEKVTGTITTFDQTGTRVEGTYANGTLTLTRDTGLNTTQNYRLTRSDGSLSGTFWNVGQFPDSGSFRIDWKTDQ